jgi:citronellol/citronellal dehydrogenase
MAKYGMSLCVLGMAEEFRDDGIAVNAMAAHGHRDRRVGDDPRRARTTRQHQAAGNHGRRGARDTDPRCARATTGNFFIDDEVLRESGVTDFAVYAVKPGMPLLPDLFL